MFFQHDQDVQALDTQNQNFIQEERKVQGVEAGAVVIGFLVTATTTGGARPRGYGMDVRAMGPAAPKLGSGPVAVGTGLASTFTAEAAAYADIRAMDTSSASPTSDCSRRCSLHVVDCRYNAR